MLTIAHAASGALIATKVSNPILSVPLILASHYLQDYILHWDLGTGLTGGKKSKWLALAQEITIDMTLAALFLHYFFPGDTLPIDQTAAFGAFVSLIPDFIEAPKNFLSWEPKIIRPFNKFHHGFHNSTTNMIVGLTPQLILLFVVGLLA